MSVRSAFVASLFALKCVAVQASMQTGRQGTAAAAVEQAETPLDIVFVSAEVAPWSKTGGLGDVVGSLPIALAARGHRVMVIAPRCPTSWHICISILLQL